MDRARAIRLLAMGDKAMTIYDGASSAWEGMKTAKTASQLMVGGVKTLSSDSGIRGPGELAITAVLTTVAGLFLFARK